MWAFKCKLNHKWFIVIGTDVRYKHNEDFAYKSIKDIDSKHKLNKFYKDSEKNKH